MGNKNQDLYLRVAQTIGCDLKTAQQLVQATFKALRDLLLAGESVRIQNFGIFHQRKVKGRTFAGTHGITRERQVFTIKPYNRIVFKPASSVRDSIREATPERRESSIGAGTRN